MRQVSGPFSDHAARAADREPGARPESRRLSTETHGTAMEIVWDDPSAAAEDA